MSQALDNFTRGIKHLIQTAIDKAPFDKTYSGRITSIDGATCTVVVNGKEYPNTPILSNKAVKVVFPQDNASQRFILNNKVIVNIYFNYGEAYYLDGSYTIIKNAIDNHCNVELNIIDDENSEYIGYLTGKEINGNYIFTMISGDYLYHLILHSNNTITYSEYNIST